MSPLNKALYSRLKEEFGLVAVTNPGVSASVSYGAGPFSTVGKVRLRIDSNGSAGEYYKVNCPYCGDSRQRLWINHLWGVPDPVTQTRNLWLAVCYNENCLESYENALQLCDRVYGFKNAKLRDKPIVVEKGIVEDGSLQVVEPPGLIKPISASPVCVAYLRDKRGLDVASLTSDYGIGVCASAREPRLRPCEGRIYIPVFMYGSLVGYQCRWPDDLDWKAAGISKYYNKPNMPRRLMFYNFDNAVKYPFVVVCEGPTDVWNVGPMAVASLGKKLSFSQLKLLCTYWGNGAVVILLDGEAWADAQRLVKELQNVRYKGAVVPVKLPEDKDPGSLTNEENLDYIFKAAEQQGVDLLSLQRSTDERDVVASDSRLRDSVERLLGNT
jgi:hypothetical protein